MLIALALLLAALILVLIKDRDFWFPPAPVAQVQSESEPVEEPSSDVKTPSETATQATPPQRFSRARSRSHTPPPAAVDPSPAPALAPVVMSRAVLPPLEVEVVAGDEHRTIPATSNSVRVDLQPRAPFSSGSSTFFPSLFRLRFRGFHRRSRCHRTRPSLCRRRPDSVPPGRTELSAAGQADEGPGRGRARSSDRTRRKYSGPPRPQRTHDSFDCGPGSSKAMAFQAVPAIRAERSKPRPALR